MMKMMKEYLKRIYPEWNEEDLKYNKWKELEHVYENKQIKGNI